MSQLAVPALVPVSIAVPPVKEILINALCALSDQVGTKTEILVMAKAIYPVLESDIILQRSLKNAFSKYLEASPIRIMLLHVN